MTYFDEHRITPIIPHPHTASEPCPGGCNDIVEVEEAACKMRKDIVELDRRMKDNHDQLTRFEARLGEGNERMGRIEIALTANAHKLDTNNEDTSEILEIMQSGKAFFRFASKAGDVLKWTLGIATAILAFWITVKGMTK